MANNFPQLPGDKNEGQSIDWSAQRNLARQWGAEAERQLKLFQQIPFEELTEEIIHSYEYWTRIKEESGHVFAEIHKAKQEQKQARNKSGQTKEERTAQYSQQAQEKYIAGSLALLKQAKEDRTRNFKESQKVINNIEKRFGSARIAQAFRAQYMNKENKITPEGEKTAVLMQRQQVFIRRLVQAIGSLPVFQKVGRAFQQLGVMTMMSGITKFRQGGIKNQVQGAGQTLLGLGVYLAPAMASAFGTVMTNIVAKKIIEAVAIGTMKGNLGGGGGFGKHVGRGALGLSTAVAGYVGASDLWKRGDAYRGSSNHQERIKGTQIRGFGNMTLTAGILAGISALFGTVALPVTLTLAAIAGVTYLIGRNVDKIWKGVDTFVGWLVSFKSWLGNILGKINPFNKGDKSNPSYTGMPVGTEEVVQAVSGKKVDPSSVHTFSTDRFNIYQYGSSRGERGGATVMGSKYTRAQLEQMGREGKGGLETLHGLRLADTFYNDARVARAGSSAILQAVQAKTGIPLTITSAMASKTSGHALGKLGHEGGQKFDFSAAGMNAQQALQYAQTLYATGYFSHAEAEYDKKTGQWHIDARIADQAYKAVEDIQKEKQQQKQVQLQKTSPRVKEAPGTAKVADVINGSLGLRNSLYGPAIGI